MSPAGPGLIHRLERAWAADAVAHADALTSIDPSWGTQTFPVGDGWAVLSGPGLYVNEVLAAGLDGSLSTAEIDRFEETAGAIGLVPAFEVSDLTRDDLVDELVGRGYAITDTVSALVCVLSPGPTETQDDIVIEEIGPDGIGAWQELAAWGWGHTEPAARRASDAFSAAALAAGQTLLIARHPDDGRPLGCASLASTEGVAILGGMSTLPDERRRGVQTALVRHRLDMARAAGCDLAAATAVVGSNSERNLIRLGFDVTHRRHTYELATPAK